jgi:hypothetical protein
MSLEAKKKARFRLLHALYEITDGDLNKGLPLFHVGDHIGLNRAETEMAGDYLEGEGLLEYRAFGPIVGLTHQGIKEVEDALDHPDRPTEHFLPLNVINVGTMIGSSIQQAGHRSNQTASVADYNPTDLGQLMTDIKAALTDPKVPKEIKEEVLADVGTVEHQLDSPKPKSNIIGEAIKSIRNVLEGIGAGIIANGIFERLKGF